MKWKNIILDLCIIIFLGIFLFSAYQIFDFQKEQRKIEKEAEEIKEIIRENEPETQNKKARFSAESFDALKAINNDYIGYLEFESQLISLPIVQTDNNSYYLKHTFKKKYHSNGAPFLDTRNILSDDNLVIYGHYVYADASKMFTPLEKLKKQENYENNQFIHLFFREEVWIYKIAYVYEHDFTKTEYDYTLRNFASEQAFNKFLNYPNQHNLINNDLKLNYGDDLLTLQTCVRNNRNKRLIVVAKLVSTEQL